MWKYRQCKQCGKEFKPRGPKKYCSRKCKDLHHVKNRIEINRKIIEDYKLSKGCQDILCKWKGNFTAEMLDLDHIDPTTKYHNVAGMLSCKTEIVLQEVGKCRVICSNCHRQHSRKNWNAYQSKKDESFKK